MRGGSLAYEHVCEPKFLAHLAHFFEFLLYTRYSQLIGEATSLRSVV